jgi:thioredoxin 1
MIEAQNDAILEQDGLNVVYFTAPWCVPCKMLKPRLEELEKANEGLTVTRVDVESNTELAKHFGIMSVPTLILFKDNVQVGEKLTGIKSKPELQKLFETYL